MPNKRRPGERKQTRQTERSNIRRGAGRNTPATRQTQRSVRSTHNTTTTRQTQRSPYYSSKPRPSLAQARQDRFDGMTLDMEGKRVVLTRRHFLYGALGAGAAAIMAAGAAFSDNDAMIDVGISVSENSVITQEDFEEVSRDDSFTLIGDHELPYGTLIWANNDDVAACLIPTNQASPLTQIAVLMLVSGLNYTLIEGAVGASEGYEIYDVRASYRGIIWIEANVLEEKWRVMAAPMSQELALGSARILDEGAAPFEIPTIAAVDDCAWWQITPSIDGEDLSEKESVLKRAAFAGGTANQVHSAFGRMACPITGSTDGVLIAAHNPDHYRAFDLLKFGNTSNKPEDVLTLPSGMTPHALGWGPNGFSFCFDTIYDYGGGISNLGTYTPTEIHTPHSSYENLSWFRFGRTPVTGPCWCGNDWLMVKSTTAVCAVNIAQQTYCSLDTESGCASWGDFLCSTGAGKRVVTAMQIDDTAPDGTTKHLTRVRIWGANSDIYG